nr:uncharacterized protein LOC111423304 [Onthophagus taurus]
MHQIPRIMQVLKHGYPPMGFLPLDPLLLEAVEIPHDTINFEIKNLQINGLSKVKIEYLYANPLKSSLELRLRFPQLSLQGFYRLKGPIYYFNIDSFGPAAMSFGDVVIHMVINFELVEIEDEIFYKMPLKPDDGQTMNVDIKKANVYFGNLIPNDPILNDRVNEMIRRTFFEAFQNVKPWVISVLWEVFRIISHPFLHNVNIDEMFDE